MPLRLMAQFVYPVGDPAQSPVPPSAPNRNGYVISQGFMNKEHHTGVDLAGPSGGQVRSIGPGTVAMIWTTAQSGGSGGFGNALLIRHDLLDGTFYSLYAHMQDGSVLVNQGDPVQAGQPIGAVDCTGYCTGPHLHFAVKRVDALGCGYIRTAHCASVDSFNNYYLPDPLQFIQAHATPGVTYTYTGLHFNQLFGASSLTTSNFISATVTLLCPIPPAVYMDISTMPIQSWTFPDGVHRISSTDPTAYLVDWTSTYLSTDGAGQISSNSVCTDGTVGFGCGWFFMPVSGSNNSMWIRSDNDWPDSVSWNNIGGARSPGPGSWAEPNGTKSCAAQNYVKYVYTGNAMSGGLSMTAFFIVPAHISPNQNATHITPLAWAISDSTYVLNLGNGDQLNDLEVSTDAQGTIIGWKFSAFGKQWPHAGGTLSTSKAASSTSDLSNNLGVIFGGCGCGIPSPYSAQNVNNPGIWLIAGSGVL